MECLAGAWSIVPRLWECSAKHAGYIGDLEDNLVSLRSERLKLKDLREDLSNRVRDAEEQQMKRTNRVNGWLERVEAMENEVDEILQKGEQELENKCLGSCCPKNCWSSYKIGKNILKMIPRVTKLSDEWEKFDGVADELPPPPVDEQPMDNIVMGFESKFEEVWQSVQNNDSHVIGLVGMGGVGKTTLLKQLNNEFLKATHTFDLVLWIVVSKPANLGKIREDLLSKLKIPDRMWEKKGEDHKNSLIFNKLKNKKFVVLLDDMWEELKLSEVGIPQPNMNNMSKIVLTTRSREVCQAMGADKIIQVDCLSADQAFTLFNSQLGEDIVKSHPKMRTLIMDVVSECEGLPLALTTTGRAMRGKKDARQWKEAKRMLEKYPYTFPGMEGSVFSKLAFSYDNLPNQMVKKCFEYCALYSEDHNIFKDEVIKLWIAEGFIGEYDSMYDALIQGRQVIDSLKQACLLETGERSYRYTLLEEPVKMHDVIRDMALWIACERGEKKNKFCVQVVSADHDDTVVAPNAMTNAEKISLRGSGITTESLAGMSFSPSLATLIIQDTRVEQLSGEIVQSMNVLKVLDLSDNRRLVGLPIKNGCLENLEYLNIANTRVRLPAKVSQWKKLRFLIVDDRIIIPRGTISSLCSLQMFEQLRVKNHNLLMEGERESMERDMLTELGGLKHIMDIRLALMSVTGVQILLNSPKLQRCTTRLVLKQVASPTLDFGTETLTKHLERLRVYYSEMSEMKLGGPSLANNLCEVTLVDCCTIRNLNSLIYVPNLCFLNVFFCSSMEELIGEETRSSNEGTSLFSSLTALTLDYVPKLRSICPQSALPFPSLEFLKVRKCENLVKLPLDSNTARTTPAKFYIKGEREWWDRLEWDSRATKDAFTPKFIVYGL